jgi:anti-sigma factor RsiW
MAEPHPADDLLLDLVLEELPEPEREQVIRHLSLCQHCRNEYDAIATAVDHALLAAPRIEPPPGFDRTVLEALGFTTTSAHRPIRTLRRRALLAAAATAVIGAVLGAGATWAVLQADEPSEQAVPMEATARLSTEDGREVGTVARSRFNGQPVLVVQVTDGKVGKRYICQLQLANGEEQAAGDWVIPSEQGAIWMVPEPESKVVEVQLLTASGNVWSSAKL